MVWVRGEKREASKKKKKRKEQRGGTDAVSSAYAGAIKFTTSPRYCRTKLSLVSR